MTLSAEFSCDKTGDRGGGGGALAHQRRLIRGLLVWATLLTLGLAASMTLHFIHRESPAPQPKPQELGSRIQSTKEPSKLPSITTFTPAWDSRVPKSVLEWNPMDTSFIEGKKQLTVKEKGEYFLYLQVTLHGTVSFSKNYTITVQTNTRNVLKSRINGQNLSTGFMGTAIAMNKGETFNVTCTPPAEIENSHIQTYMGVIRFRSN